MSKTRSVNLESESVVQKKGSVVLKALSELIATKYKVAIKKAPQEKPMEVLNPPKSEIIRRVRLLSNLNEVILKKEQEYYLQ